MSGIDIAGLVLGGIPLLISAFEHWRDLCVTLEDIRRFEIRHAEALGDVKDEQIRFQLHLKKLLIPLAEETIGANEVHSLLLHPGGTGWQETKVEDALKSRLADVYPRYMEILQEIPGILHKLLMMLGFKLQGGSSSFQNKLKAEEKSNSTAKFKLKLRANARFVSERVDFVTSKWSREKLLHTLHQKIEKLDAFLTSRDELATLEQSQIVIPRKAIKALLQHWTHADRVYKLIDQRMACSCKQSHCAQLWLHHQANPVFELKLLVLYCSPAAQHLRTNGWQPQGLQIRQSTDDNSPNASASTNVSATIAGNVSSPPAPTSVPLLKNGEGLKNPSCLKNTASSIRPRVSMKIGFSSHRTRRFALPESTSSGIENLPSNTKKKVRIDIGDSDSTSASASIQEIQNLCEALAALGMGSVCVGLLTDQNIGCSYQVISQPQQKIVANETTLWHALQRASPRISRATRFQLALKISSSHLKLQSTYWARRQWVAKDVRFPSLDGGEEQVLYTDPYISTDFNSVVASSQMTCNRSFASLGIMLLELLFGEVLENHEFWERLNKHDKANQSHRKTVALIWANSVQEELPGEPGKIFYNAVIWCLNFSPSTLEGDEWRKELADQVVLPLEKCCEWMQVKPV